MQRLDLVALEAVEDLIVGAVGDHRAHPLFRAPPSCNVAGNSLNGRRLSILKHQFATYFQRQDATIQRLEIHFVIGAFLPGEFALKHLTVGFDQFWREESGEIRVQQSLSGVSRDYFSGPVYRGHIAVEIERVDNIVRVLDQVAITLFTLSQRLLGPFALLENLAHSGFRGTHFRF